MTSRVSGDGWTGRLEQLAALVRMDALAIVLPSRDTPTTYAAFNTSNLAWPNTPAARDLGRMVRQGDPSAILERAVGHLAELFSADGVSIMLIENGELVIRSSRGLSDEAKRSRRAIGEGISGGVARSGQPTLLVGPISGAVDQTVSESMIVPLRAAERTIGVVNVKHRAPQSRYAQAQLDALALFAQDIASAYSTALELQGAIDDRQQAIVLYELSRFASL